MRSFLAFIAALFGLGALVAVAADAAASSPFRLRPLGEVWFALHPDSFQLLQPAIERHIHPDAWDRVAEPVIFTPLVAILAGIAIVLFLLSRLFSGVGPQRLA